MIDQGQLQVPDRQRRMQAAAARLVEGVHQLAIDIQLELLVRGVADADRP
jgi:hypothetical protein